MERKLSAIMMMDVVGYSSLMERAEEETVLKLKGLRKQVVDPQILEHSGKIVKTTGDGLLVEFGSAVQAVKAGLQIQTDLADWEVDAPEDARIVVRIGISVGDVLVDGDDLLGDAVNLAARMESLARPGGICISSSVHDYIRGDLGSIFRDGGAQHVKNISRPINVFHWHGDSTTEVRPSTVARARSKPQVYLDDFTTSGASDDSLFLADGCRHAVQALLSKFTGLQMTLNADKAEHRASANFQVIGTRYRVTVHLQDTQRDTTYTTSQFDGVIDDPFAVQDKLSGLIATTIRYGVHDRESEMLETDQDSASDYEAMMTRVGSILLRSDAEEWREADQLLEKILAVTPDNFMALSMKAVACLEDVIVGYRSVRPDFAKTAELCSRRALEQNMNSDFAYVAAANVKFYVHGDVAGALRDMGTCLEISPGYPIGQMFQGLCLVADDQPQEGLQVALEAADAMKRTQIHHRILQIVATAHFSLGDHQACLANCQRVLQQFPSLPQAMLLEIAARSEAGDMDVAKSLTDALLIKHPDFRLSELAVPPYRNAETRDRYLHALRQAGLPA